MARRVPTPFAIERFTKAMVAHLLEYAEEIGIVDDKADYDDMRYHFPHSYEGEAGVDYGDETLNGVPAHEFFETLLGDLDDTAEVPEDRMEIIRSAVHQIPMTGYMKIGTKSQTDKLWKEYDEFAEDPEIGSLYSEDWTIIYGTFVAHELAHVIDYMEFLVPREEYQNEVTDGHGFIWQSVYRIFRRYLGLTLENGEMAEI